MNPKYLLLLCISVTCFITSPATAQTKEENIDRIRKIFQQTNSEKNLTQVKLENDELTEEVADGGISLTGYFKEETLVKISLWSGLSYGITEIEYYFSKDSLLFVYVTEKHFRETGDTMDHSKVDLKFEGRYYYKNDQLIHQATKGTGFFNNSNDRRDSLLTDSNNYLRFLYMKKGK